MPRQPHILVAVPAAITKGELAAVIRPLKGYVNSQPVTLNGVTYDPDTIAFKTFAGGLNLSDHLYHGVYEFVAPDVMFSVADLNALPGLAPEPQPAPADVIPSDV